MAPRVKLLILMNYIKLKNDMNILRTILLHLNAVFPFLLPMRFVISGRVFGGIYHFIKDGLKYRVLDRRVNSGFPLRLRYTYPCYLDRYEMAGSLPRHYFWQDLWGARKIYRAGVKVHFDIGSRLDGFIAHCLPFCDVVMLDIWPLPISIEGLRFQQVDCMNMGQIPDGAIPSLSSFHAVEHFGLGRYGDPVDPEGYRKAISEMKRIVCPGGQMLFSVPIGIQRLEFNGHRIFDPMTVIQLFEGFELVEFSVIDDEDKLHEAVRPEDYRQLKYGCGLYHFKKQDIN